MSSFDYSGLQAKAAALLSRYGRDVTLRRLAAAAYNTSTGLAALTPTDTVYKGALFDFGAGITEQRGELVQADDQRLLLEGGVGVAPDPKDLVLVGAAQYSIVSVGKVSPAGTPVLFDLHLRK